MTTNIEKLEEEKETIIYCASQFGSFSKYNGLIPYNDAIKDFIHTIIYDENSKTGNTINLKHI